jgi:hypothetical protein
MTDEANKTAAAAGAKAPSIVAMESRRIFDSTDAAIEYLTGLGAKYHDFGRVPFVGTGIGEDGNFDPAVYVNGMRVMVSKLTNKGSKEKGTETTMKAIVVAPVPSLELLMSTEGGPDFVNRVLATELNHIAVRQLRNADDVSTEIGSVPTTVDGYINTGNGEGASLLDAYNALWQNLNKALAAKIPAWARARFTKQELKKALESAAYAREIYSALEDRPAKADGTSGSLFVAALVMLTSAAKRDALDSTLFERWATNRDAAMFDPASETEIDFDMDELAASLLAPASATPIAGAETGTGNADDSTAEAEQPVG